MAVGCRFSPTATAAGLLVILRLKAHTHTSHFQLSVTERLLFNTFIYIHFEKVNMLDATLLKLIDVIDFRSRH